MPYSVHVADNFHYMQELTDKIAMNGMPLTLDAATQAWRGSKTTG
jgi:hypothetical protein